MFCLLIFVPALLFMCVESISVSQEDGGHVLEERGVPNPRGGGSPELLDHLEKSAKNDDIKGGARPFQIPTAKGCVEAEKPSYAKATCTSYPGRIVCQLGRYTFVINNGEHKMNPEIIERFAAMVYHRSQEGDSDFDVSVDIPVKISEDYFVLPQHLVETTTPRVLERKYPVFVECSPLIDERKMCNPPYTPSEVIYSCKRKDLGFGGFGSEHAKRMVISVNEEGIVSAGDLVLPYNALIDRRMKRQREKEDKAELIRLTPSGTDNKLYSDVCSFQTKSWCPNFVGTECPPSCRTENQTVVDECAGLKAASPAMAVEVPAAPAVPQVSSEVNQHPAKAQGSSLQSGEGLGLTKNDEAELYAVSNLAAPQVRIYTDICMMSTVFPWCPPSKGDAIECSVPTCVTIDPCATTTICRQRRELAKEKKAGGQLSRHLQNRIRAGRKLGPKRIYRKRKRQANIARFHIFKSQTENFLNHATGKSHGASTTGKPDNDKSSTTHQITSTQNKHEENIFEQDTSDESLEMETRSPQCTVAPECTSASTLQCTLPPECATTTLLDCTLPPQCTSTSTTSTANTSTATTSTATTPTATTPTATPSTATTSTVTTSTAATSAAAISIQCTLPPHCTASTIQCTLPPQCTATNITQSSTTPGSSALLECKTPPECATMTKSAQPKISIMPESMSVPVCTTMPHISAKERTSTKQRRTMTECVTESKLTNIPLSSTALCSSNFPTTEYIEVKKLGFNRVPLFKREMMRRKKPTHIQWPIVSRERYILE